MKSFTLLFFLCCCFAAPAQKKISTLTFQNLEHSGINPAGELYTAADSHLSRFDKDGNLMKSVSLSAEGAITQFDAWHLTQVVLYFRASQRIDIYNPELELRTSFVIDSAFAIEPTFIAASFDQKHFWIFDKADGSIKKVNYKTGEVVIDEIIHSFKVEAEPILSMREYQRFLFVQTTQQLYVFNAIGQAIKVITSKPEQVFDFFGEEIFLLDKTTLHFNSLFTKEERLKESVKAFDKIFLTDERLFGLIGHSIEIFAFNPN